MLLLVGNRSYEIDPVHASVVREEVTKAQELSNKLNGRIKVNTLLADSAVIQSLLSVNNNVLKKLV